jgi:signal transduction histidine kinase
MSMMENRFHSLKVKAKDIVASKDKMDMVEYIQKLESILIDSFEIIEIDKNIQNNELALAKSKAEESERLKNSFLTNMSHEIRTPMNGIIGFANLLGSSEVTPEKKDHFIGIINSSANQLLTIISDIIDISKIEAGQLDIEENKFELNPLIINLKEQFDIEKARKGKGHLQLIAETPDPNTLVVSDEIRIKQVFSNLLNNAIKFTEKGYIKFGYFYKKDDLVYFVEDSGKGIPQEHLGIIFEHFRQGADSNTREYGGTGLGLTISKALVEKMGGTISVKSELGKGSVFYFTTRGKPFKNGFSTNMEKESSGSELDLSHMTILVVEDMDIARLLIHEIFQPTGANLIMTDMGREAIMICKENCPDLVLMDIQLPDINGYEATKEIRKFAPKLPIIAQTAYAMPGDQALATKAGCNGYIPKPYNRSMLLQMIKKYV